MTLVSDFSEYDHVTEDIHYRCKHTIHPINSPYILYG